MIVGDHDFTACSIIPSVSLFLTIPDTISGSFYRCRVFVSFKDAVFEQSSALRHAAEISTEIGVRSKPIMQLYTDGGPDSLSPLPLAAQITRKEETGKAACCSRVINFRQINKLPVTAARLTEGETATDPVLCNVLRYAQRESLETIDVRLLLFFNCQQGGIQ